MMLLVGAFFSAGFGHGSYLPFVIAAAPVSLIPTVGLFAAPVWWAVAGVLSRWKPGAFQAMLVAHVLSVALILWLGSPMEPGDEIWRYVADAQRRIPTVIWGTLSLYLGGQVIAWSAVFAHHAWREHD